MSTIYKGKINFTKDELMTKYDKISLLNDSHIRLTFPCINLSYYINKRKIHALLPSKIKNNIEKLTQNNEITKGESKTYNVKAEDWMDPINDLIEFNYCFEGGDNYHLECEFCKINDSKTIVTSTFLNIEKLELINAVVQCILYGMKGGPDILPLCSVIKTSDPEFLLKVSLFCRREFNVRTVSNHLLALAASLPECNIYLKKYFSTCVNLPTDWIEVVQQYMIIAQSIKLPAKLRRVLVSKFNEFNTYQIGKYQNKTLEVEIESKKIKLTLKSLIRTLHISEPVDHVMCLLGKNYPKSNEEFVSSNLPGEWDQEKAGKRMKVPTPETWETQISINGNKPEIWEKLIDTKKLPYMAMIRNLRNILQANVKDRYHEKVAYLISQESKVINGKLLPFQYFTAFKVLDEYNEDILKAKEKLSVLYVKNPQDKPVTKTKGKGQKKNAKDPNEKRDRIRKIVRLRKIMGRPLVSENIIQKYTKALNKAVEISTTYNIPCIRGRVLIISNVGDETIYPKFKYGTSKSVKEVVALLTSMCYFASECTDIILVKEARMVMYKIEKRPKSLLTLSSDILKYEFNYASPLDLVFEEMISKQIQFDLIILFDVPLRRDLLIKYKNLVNSSVSIFINNIASDGDKTFDCENISSISGFNDQVIKIISEQSNGGFIKKLDSIDKRYNLDDNILCFKKIICLPQIEPDFCDRPDQSQVTDINIFISSTFLDMDRERSFINKVIIPAVKKQLKMKNINFININCIDLRWGVPVHLGCSEEMLKYCIEQVKRCHIFVGMLGTRYGWIPDKDIVADLSETYPEFYDLESHSITHIEYKFAPSDCHKIFLLQPLTEEACSETNLEDFHNEIKNKEIFYEYSPENLLTDFKVLIPYITKVVSDNFVGENLTVPRICMKHQRFNRQRLVKQSLTNFLEYSTRNVDTQKDAVEEIISLLEHDLKIKVKLYCDRKKRDESDNIVDKKKIVAKEEIMDKFGGIALIEGKVGSGKTSLVAGVIKEFVSPKYEEKYTVSGKLNRRKFIWFYDSIKYIYDENGKSVTLFDLLYDMIEFIMLDLGYDFTDKLKNELGLYGDGCVISEFWKPTDIRNAVLVWTALLKILDMVDGIQVTFFLDGLDELEDSIEACSLNWIPLSLSSKVRFVINAVTDSSLSKCIKLRNDYIVYEIKSIPMKHKRTVIDNLLMSQGKSLNSVPFNNQMSEFTLKSDSDKPKYLELAVNYLLLYATFDKVKETITSMPSTLGPLILHSLKSLEKEIPKEICMVYFSFISHSKSGLRNEDLQKLMSVYFMVSKKKLNCLISRADFDDLKVASKSPAGFSLYPLMLIRNFSQLLIEEGRNQRIFIKDKGVKTIISRYCETVNSQAIHYILSLYYDDLIERTSDDIAFRDIIYHKYHSMMFDECLELLTNISYIRDRFELGLAMGLLRDYMGYEDAEDTYNAQWLNVCQNEKFINFKNFVTKNFDILSNWPDLFLQQAINEPPESHVRLAYDNVNMSSYDFGNRNVILKLERLEIDYHQIHSSVIRTNDKITCVALSTKLALVALGYDNGLIQLFSNVTFQIVSNLRRHVLRVNGVCFIESSKKIVSAGEDNKAFVWNAQDGSLLHELNGHSRSVTDCAFCVNADIICTAGLDAQCILWKQDTYNLHHTFKSGSPINCLTVCKSKILIGCWDGNMIIYNAIDLVRTAVIHNSSSVRSVSINKFYPTFLASNVRGHLSIWNSTIGVKLKEFSTIYRKYPTAGKFSSDGLKFFEYAGNNTQHEAVAIWSTSIGYHENAKQVEDICCIDSNSIFIVCGTRYGKVVIIDRVTLQTIMSDNVSDAELTAISINRSEKSFKNCVAVSDYYNNLHLFEIVGKLFVLKLKIDNLHNRPINSLIWSSCYIISGSDDCFINIVNMKERSNNDFIFSIKDIFRNSILALDVRKGRILASSKDKSIGLFSINDRSILNHQVHAHDDWVTCVRFLSSVSFVSGSNDFAVKIWQMTMESSEDTNTSDDNRMHFSSKQVTFTVLHTLIGHMGLVTSLSFNNAELIASASNDGSIKLWQLQGLFADNLVIHSSDGDPSKNNESILWVKFHETNGTLLALDKSDNLHIFNFEDKNCQINQLTSHQGPVTCVSNTDNILYTLSLDASLRQWNLSEILSKNRDRTHRIIDSLHIPKYRGSCDVIVAFCDMGLLLFMDQDVKTNTWNIVDTIDMKATFEGSESDAYFTSPYLICEGLKQHNDISIDILFSKITFRYQMQTKTFKKVTSEIVNRPNRSSIDLDDIQVNENHFLKLVHDGKKLYFLRVAKRSNFLELFSRDPDTKDLTALAKIPLNGLPCHMMVFKTNDAGYTCFVAYEQGTFDFIALKQIVN